jgi:hypothetical protein
MRHNALSAKQNDLPARIADARRARSAFDAFYDKYDALIGLLCLAAREGVTSEYERQYREARGWFVKRYRTFKAPLGHYLSPDGADVYYRKSDRVPCDAFEAMFMPKTISSMFESDGGALIERMMRTQHALGSWDDAIATAEIEFRLQALPSEFRPASLAAI